MMGTKARHFAPLINVSVEQGVPQDHFYRRLEHILDLSFVRETYVGKGRTSIDPVVFFKLQLVMFFENIRSEHLLMRHAADRLSVHWYLGYDLDEALPDHSSLTRIRERYGGRGLSPLLRVDCGAVPAGRTGVGQRAVFRRDESGRQCLYRLTDSPLCYRSPSDELVCVRA